MNRPRAGTSAWDGRTGTLILVIPVAADMWRDMNHDRRKGRWDMVARTGRLRHLGFLMGRSAIHQHHLDTPVFDRCRVECAIAYPPSAHRADPANAASTVKPLVDGLTDAGLWVDDDSTHVLSVSYRRDPEPAPSGSHMVTVRAHRTNLSQEGRTTS